MTMEHVASTEPVSKVEPVQAPVAEVKAAEPLTAEAVQKMIAESTAKAVAEAKDIGRRELQSQQDRHKAETERLQRRATIAESSFGAARATASKLDPEVATALELAELRAREQQRVADEQTEQARQQQEGYANTLRQSLTSHLKNLNIAENDPRVDWAMDARDYLSGRGRFDASVAQILKEENLKVLSPLEQRLKDLEALIKKTNVEVNSVPAGTPPGVVSGSDADFVKKFANDEIPFTKANVERYNKIINS